jgi:hypothetical protein
VYPLSLIGIVFQLITCPVPSSADEIHTSVDVQRMFGGCLVEAKTTSESPANSAETVPLPFGHAQRWIKKILNVHSTGYVYSSINTTGLLNNSSYSSAS